MTTYNLALIRRLPFSNDAVAPTGQLDLDKDRQQQQMLELIDRCYGVVPAVLHELQQLYPGTKFVGSKSKLELQEAFKNGSNRPACAWHLIQEMIVLRVVLNVDSDSLPESLTCYFGLWQAECEIDAEKLAATLMKLIAAHGGWTPAINHVPLHPYAG